MDSLTFFVDVNLSKNDRIVTTGGGKYVQTHKWGCFGRHCDKNGCSGGWDFHEGYLIWKTNSDFEKNKDRIWRTACITLCKSRGIIL